MTFIFQAIQLVWGTCQEQFRELGPVEKLHPACPYVLLTPTEELC